MFLFSFCSIVLNLVNKNTSDFVHDEHGFVVAGSLLFNEFFIERDYSSDVWQQDLDNYGVHNPRVGLYILGGLNQFTNLLYSKFYFENDNKIFLLRCFVSVFAAGSVLLIFLFFLKSEGKKTAFIAVFLLLVNPIFRSIQSALTTDIYMFFFFALSLFCLLIIDEFCQKRQWSFKWFLLFALAAGLAVSCKIYAVCIYFTLCLVLLKNFSRDMWQKNILSFLLVSFGILAVFVISNPLLYTDFFNGMYALTKGHVEVSEYPVILNVLELRHMFLSPYLLFRWNAFDIAGISNQEPMIFVDYVVIAFIYVFVIRGMFVCCMRKRYLPVFLFVVSKLWIAYPIMALGYYWIIPKMFMITTVAIIYMVSVSFSDLLSFCFNSASLKKG